MRKTLSLFLIGLFHGLVAQDQPLENVFLHLSSTNLMSGEYLHFSAYAYSEKGSLTDLSSILYVEIIDNQGRNVTKSKVELSDGRGFGRIFIPTELRTGIYFLSGYTRWMKNDRLWFKQPLTIINPYLSYYSNENTVDGTYVPKSIETSIQLDSFPRFKKDAKIVFEIPIPDTASLSISVSRLHNHYFQNEFKEMAQLESESSTQVFLYPEHQYGVIQGTSSIPNSWVTLSLQSESLEIDAVQSDDAGNFSLIYNPSNYTSGLGSVKVNDSDDGAFMIFPEYYESYPQTDVSLRFSQIDLEEIKQRSVNSQLVNAYSKPKMNIESAKGVFIPGELTKIYKLDEYKRFDTMRDTFIEVIYEVAASKNEQNNSLIVRSEFIGKAQKEYAPLILLDGVEVSSDYLLQLSPYLVERIEILPQVYFIGAYTINGIISVHSFKKDLINQSDKTIVRLEPVESNNDSKLITNNLKETRYPHLESLLYWNANLSHTGENFELKLNSSDYSGIYLLSIRGISRSGRKIDLNHYFIVE